LPASKDMIALLQIRQDPVAFYSPMVKKNNQDYYLAGPVSGMAEELAELFMLPVRSGIRRGPIAPAEREEEEDDVEVGRRDERRASERLGQGAADITLDDDLGGFGGFGDDTGLELEPVEGLDDVAAGELARKRDASLAPSMAERFSRAGSVARSIIEARVEASGLSDECPIAFFDTRLRVNGVPQAGGLQSQVSEDFRSTSTGQGWSKNTVMAVEYLKGELQNGEDEDASLSFNAAAKAVSRAYWCLDPTRFVNDDIYPTVFETRGVDNVL
jgi:cohesin complex subunit SCC1